MYPVYESVKSNSIFFLRTKYCEIIINHRAIIFVDFMVHLNHED
jgi:hypothetical protein